MGNLFLVHSASELNQIYRTQVETCSVQKIGILRDKLPMMLECQWDHASATLSSSFLVCRLIAFVLPDWHRSRSQQPSHHWDRHWNQTCLGSQRLRSGNQHPRQALSVTMSKLDSGAMFDVFHWRVLVVVLWVVVNYGIRGDPVLFSSRWGY